MHEPTPLQNDKIAHLARERLLAMLLAQEADGHVVDLAPDVATHQLLLVLSAWREEAFASAESRAVQWFAGLDDEREKSDRDFNPFKLTAFTHLKSEATRDYVAVKIDALRKFHRRADGYTVLHLGFTKSGDVRDVFPTLLAADLLLTEGSEASIVAAVRTLDWAINEIQKDIVYQNVSSILGFAALVARRHDQVTGQRRYDGVVRELKERLVATQENGLWEKDRYQSCYAFYDIAALLEIEPDPSLSAPFMSFLEHVLDPQFFKDPKIAGQNETLTTATLLRAFALILSKAQRARVVADVADDLLQRSRDYVRHMRAIEKHEAALAEIFDDLNKRRLMAINPIVFNTREFQRDAKLAFVLMPFGNKRWFDHSPIGPQDVSYNFDPLYEKIIAPTIREMHLTCVRADELFSQKQVMEKIWQQINCAALVVADVTSTNPNVLYELGIAHTLGKAIVILTQNQRYIPFDLQNYDYVKYDSQLGNEEDLRTNLRDAIQQTLGGR